MERCQLSCRMEKCKFLSGNSLSSEFINTQTHSKTTANMRAPTCNSTCISTCWGAIKRDTGKSASLALPSMTSSNDDLSDQRKLQFTAHAMEKMDMQPNDWC